MGSLSINSPGSEVQCLKSVFLELRDSYIRLEDH